MGQGFLRGQGGNAVKTGTYSYVSNSPPSSIVVSGLGFTPKKVEIRYAGDNASNFAYNGAGPYVISAYTDGVNQKLVVMDTSGGIVRFVTTGVTITLNSDGFTVTYSAYILPRSSTSSATIFIDWIATD